MAVLKQDKDGNWVPAEQIPLKNYFIYRAGYKPTGYSSFGKWFVWIGPYQIGLRIPC